MSLAEVEWELVQPRPDTARRLMMPGLSKLQKTWKHNPIKAGMRMCKLRPLLAGCTTFITDHTEPLASHSDTPLGLKCFVLDSPIRAQTLLQTQTELARLFSNLSSYNSALNVDAVTIIEDEGKIFWPSWSLGKIADKSKWYMPVNTATMLQFLETNQFHCIAKLFNHHYDDILANIYSQRTSDTMSLAQLKTYVNQNSTMQFLKYAPGAGMNQHIDNLLRCDSTVFTIGIGRKVVYDLSPVLHPTHKFRGHIVRVTLPEGSAVVMNDDARYHWTHGIPEEEDGSVKYTIIWFLHHTPEMVENHMEKRDFSSILGCDMYSLRFA